jgi:hypothetical protein
MKTNAVLHQARSQALHAQAFHAQTLKLNAHLQHHIPVSFVVTGARHHHHRDSSQSHWQRLTHHVSSQHQHHGPHRCHHHPGKLRNQMKTRPQVTSVASLYQHPFARGIHQAPSQRPLTTGKASRKCCSTRCMNTRV